MAITDDNGLTWHASKPLFGFGNIQPTVMSRNDGTLVRLGTTRLNGVAAPG